MFTFNKSSGQASKFLLVLAAVILVAVIIVFLVMRMAEKPAKPVVVPEEQQVAQPVYEQTLAGVRFVFQSARDMGKVLSGSATSNPEWQKDLTTTEKFIRVTIGAQNKTTVNIPGEVWDIGNIVDSEGRNYEPLDYTAKPWLPNVNPCGTLLKPEFEPTSCTQMYEVSKASTGLKIVVTAKKKQGDSYSSTDKESAMLDLIVK